MGHSVWVEKKKYRKEMKTEKVADARRCLMRQKTGGVGGREWSREEGKKRGKNGDNKKRTVPKTD